MRKLYVLIVIVVAVICIGAAVEMYRSNACAGGFCYGKCTSNAQCGQDCYCNYNRALKYGYCESN